MNEQLFNVRKVSSRALPRVITGGTPERGSPNARETWLKVLAGYSPHLPWDLDNPLKWPKLPRELQRSHGGSQIHDSNLRKRFAQEAAASWVTRRLVRESLEQLRAAMNIEPNRFREVRVVYPALLSAGRENNLVPRATAERLKAVMEGIRFPLPFVFETLDTEVRNLSEGIFIVGKADRGVPKLSPPQFQVQKQYVYGIQRLARQVFVAGAVREDALYWLVDDGITLGGTLCNYLNYIRSKNGTVGALTALSLRYRGAERLAADDDLLQLLAKCLDAHSDHHYRGIEPNHRLRYDLQIAMRTIGLSLSLPQNQMKDGPTTMTAQELFTLTAFFLCCRDSKLYSQFIAIAERYGMSPTGDAYPIKIAKLEEGSFYNFQSMLSHALLDRSLDATFKSETPFPGSRGTTTIASRFSDYQFTPYLRCWEADPESSAQY